MKLLQPTTVLLLSFGVLTQTGSAGPFEGLRNFFTGHREQPERVEHHHPHPKIKDKDAPNGSPTPVAPATDQQPNSQQPNSQQPNSQQPNSQQPNSQQPNGSPAPQNTLNTANTLIITNTNRPGRPDIAAAALY
jgi:hypothetical protein